MLNDTTKDIEDLQNDLWMKRTAQERARFVSAMFFAARQAIISSLPKNLSEREIKRQIYQRTYGKPLPADFFKDEE